MKENLYDPALDPRFQSPFIDAEEWREDISVGCTYVHGGFDGTDLRFSFFFPKKEDYGGRFFQFMAPAEGSENASVGRTGAEDRIGFALTHGAYFVESNMGSLNSAHRQDSTVIYKASAAAAEYSRVVAARLYGEHRPYGYIYGGSGGAFKTASCFENTNAWDGAIPYIHGSPMAIPNVFCARAYAKRVLRRKFPAIVDALEPGGSGDPYDALNEEEAAVLREVSRLGFPLRSWFYWREMDDGAFPVVAKGTIGIDSGYYEDFWTLPGYEGADPESSVHRDRIRCEMTVREVLLPGQKSREEIEAEKAHLTGADSAWKRNRSDYGSDGDIRLVLDGAPAGDMYAYGAELTVTDGEAAGLKLTAAKLEGATLTLTPQFGDGNVLDRLKLLAPGDRVYLDNSDYLAAQTYYRHQTPPADDYAGWEQFKTEDGGWRYPQRALCVGPLIARGSCGSLQEGSFNGKMIVVAATMDESAFPWQIDWYRGRVKKYFGGETDDRYRVYFFDHAFHDDQASTVDETHLISYLGGLHQALLDLSAWVERGVTPPDSTRYAVEEGQIVLPGTAEERLGIQPVVRLTANGGKKATVKPGEAVTFRAEIQIPPNTGTVTRTEWSFDGEPYRQGDGTMEHAYDTPGTHFAAVRVSIQRDGRDDVFTQVRNLDRARVVVG